MSKKKLDELFQEKFLDFKEKPDDKVWASIEASLDKKKKKRVIPLWWQLGGIAAVLLVGLIVFNPFNKNNVADEIITDVEHVDENNDDQQINGTNETPFQKDDSDEIEIVTNDSLNKKESEIDHNEVQITAAPEKKIQQFDSKSNTSSKQGKVATDNWSIQKEAVVETQKEKEKTKSIQKNHNLDFKEVETSNSDVAQTDVETIKEDTSNTATANSNETNNKGKNELNVSDAQTAIAKEDIEKEDLEQLIEDPKKKSIFEEIENQKEEAVVENSGERWSAGPNIAPVYFNAFGEGSPVHSIFVPNSKSGNVNLSYGLSVAYEISPKLSVRSGINKVDYGYDTNDVAFSSSPSASTNGQIDNIDYTLTSKNLVVTSKPGGNPNSESFSSIDVSAAADATREGVMSQQLGYLEVPIELNYALIDNKFGVNIIGGVSSLFLVNNAVALTSGSLTTEMGEANNVNDLNFSANMGLGVNYKFSPKVRLNIEPVFKYQLNTFSETDGTFRPYSIGVYSGLSFRF